MNIGRNEECYCGSGKKYKKCCMKKKDSLDSIMFSELEQLQVQLFNYIGKNNPDRIISMLAEELPLDTTDSQLKQNVTFLLAIWFIFHKPYETKTLAEKFIEEKRNDGSIRPSVLEQLEKWSSTVPSFSEVTNVIDTEWIEVEDIETKEKKKVRMPFMNYEMEKGIILFGFLLPYGNSYSYMRFALDFVPEETPNMLPAIMQLYKNSGKQHMSEFLMEQYPEVIKVMILEEPPAELPAEEATEMNETAEDSTSEMTEEWSVEKEASAEQAATYRPRENPVYGEIPGLLFSEEKQEGGLSARMMEEAENMWRAYCAKAAPIIRKPEIYAAGLHYLMESNVPGTNANTQKGLAATYGVSAASLSKAYRAMESELSEELEQLKETFCAGIR
ncbi:SEC-C metal-binding domain-containing protein [Bacillus massilinigeriensis]|uniref:SEC-C metal-binding domain-containing protein n=1 Tax=Bacillus mediterraneensis TaxID=1805474 RepID=UPI0008F8EC1C|nr:SEC-C metal-binding domain-containing protein [Bacillus mediterraneensis]